MEKIKGRFKKGNTIGKEFRFKKGQCAFPNTGFKKGNTIGKEFRFKKGDPKPKNSYSFPKDYTPWSKGKKRVFSKETLKKMSRFKGEKSPHFKGIIKHNGYIFLYCPNHPYCTKRGYVKRSRLVMEKYLKRFLTEEEVMHHKGTKYPIGSIENIQDDRLKNLQLFADGGAHTRFHRKA